jgi:CHAT domain-containing protein
LEAVSPQSLPLRGRDVSGNVLLLEGRVGKEMLVRGETTWLKVSLEGAEGVEKDLCLRLRNHTPGTVRFVGPSSTVIPSEELNRGRSTFRTNIEGISPGRFNIAPEVSECSEQDYEEALRDYNEALPAARRANHREAEAALLRNMGLARERLGQLAEAATRYAEALALFREIGARARETDTLTRQGSALLRSGKTVEAIDSFKRSLKIAGDLKLPFWLWRSHKGLGDCYEAQSDLRAALREYKSAVESIEEMGPEFDGQRRAVFETLAVILARQNQVKEALEVLQHARSQALRAAVRKEEIVLSDSELLSLVLRSENLEQQRVSAWETIRDEESRSKNDQDRGLIEAATRVLASTERELNETLTEIKQRDASFASLSQVDPSLWVDAQQLLPPGVLLVEYFPADKNLFIFALTAQGKPMLRQVQVTRAALEETVGRYVRQLLARADVSEASRRLYALLIEPVQKEIDAASVVALMPSSVLFYVPFASLARQTPQEKLRYLVEDKPLVHLTDLTAWRLMRQNGQTTSYPNSVLVAFANPTGDLPAAETEVDAIGRNYTLKEVFRRDEATKGRVQNIRDDCTVLHIATHGVLNSDVLTSSYLRMAAGDRLTQGEVYGLGLRRKRTRLVVLSACETAVGARRPGLEFLGLADAFAKAGAASVLGTLWKVADKSTAQLLSAFHASIKSPKGGATKAEALRQAQLGLLRGGSHQHPFYWAGFVLVGEWR